MYVCMLLTIHKYMKYSYGRLARQPTRAGEICYRVPFLLLLRPVFVRGTPRLLPRRIRKMATIHGAVPHVIDIVILPCPSVCPRLVPG